MSDTAVIVNLLKWCDKNPDSGLRLDDGTVIKGRDMTGVIFSLQDKISRHAGWEIQERQRANTAEDALRDMTESRDEWEEIANEYKAKLERTPLPAAAPVVMSEALAALDFDEVQSAGDSYVTITLDTAAKIRAALEAPRGEAVADPVAWADESLRITVTNKGHAERIMQAGTKLIPLYTAPVVEAPRGEAVVWCEKIATVNAAYEEAKIGNSDQALTDAEYDRYETLLAFQHWWEETERSAHPPVAAVVSDEMAEAGAEALAQRNGKSLAECGPALRHAFLTDATAVLTAALNAARGGG